MLDHEVSFGATFVYHSPSPPIPRRSAATVHAVPRRSASLVFGRGRAFLSQPVLSQHGNIPLITIQTLKPETFQP